MYNKYDNRFGHAPNIEPSEDIKNKVKRQKAEKLPALSTEFYFAFLTFKSYFLEVANYLKKYSTSPEIGNNIVIPFLELNKNIEDTNKDNIDKFQQRYADFLMIDFSKINFKQQKVIDNEKGFINQTPLVIEHENMITEKYIAKNLSLPVTKPLEATFNRVLKTIVIPDIFNRYGVTTSLTSIQNETNETEAILFLCYPKTISKDAEGILSEKPIKDAAEKFFGYMVARGFIEKEALSSPEIIFQISTEKVNSVIKKLKDDGVEPLLKEPIVTADMLRSNPHWSR